MNNVDKYGEFIWIEIIINGTKIIFWNCIVGLDIFALSLYKLYKSCLYSEQIKQVMFYETKETPKRINIKYKVKMQE